MSTPSSETVCGESTAAECCGGTTAGCVAVWCCCPCGIVNLLVLAVYKVPAGLCRKALRHHRQKRLVKPDLFSPQVRRSNSRPQCWFRDSGFALRRWGIGDSPREKDDLLDLRIVEKFQNTEEEEEEEDDQAVAALEKEMWIRFCGTGFWRSSSQIETTSFSSPTTAKTGMLQSPWQNETASVSRPSTPKGALLRGPLQMETTSSLVSTPRGPSRIEAVAVPSPKGSFTTVFNNASLIVIKQ